MSNPTTPLQPNRTLQPPDLPGAAGHLLQTLLERYPQIRTVRECRRLPGWDGQTGTMHIEPPTQPIPDQVRTLLHEGGHATLGHAQTYNGDIDAYWDDEEAACHQAHTLAHELRFARYLSDRQLEANLQDCHTWRTLCWELAPLVGTADQVRLRHTIHEWCRTTPIRGKPATPAQLLQIARADPQPFLTTHRDFILRGWVQAFQQQQQPAVPATRQENARWILQQISDALACTYQDDWLPPPSLAVPAWTTGRTRHVWVIHDGYTGRMHAYEALFHLAHHYILTATMPRTAWSEYTLPDNGPSIWHVEITAHDEQRSQDEAEIWLVPQRLEHTGHSESWEDALRIYIASWGDAVGYSSLSAWYGVNELLGRIFQPNHTHPDNVET